LGVVAVAAGFAAAGAVCGVAALAGAVLAAAFLSGFAATALEGVIGADLSRSFIFCSKAARAAA